MLRRFATAVLTAALLLPAVQADQQPRPMAGSHILEELYAEEIARIREIPVDELPEVAPKKTVPIGGWTDFWSINMVQNQPFQVHAQLRHVGEHCYIYVQEGHDLSDQVAERLAHQFDTQIYPTDRKYFGSERTPGVDWDPRITLLLMDIQDGWSPGKGYVAGYYFPLDGVSTRLFPQSNEREMFYLDVYPGDPTREDYLGILAHEFQHMIHNNWDAKETRWLNEALAQIAFYVNDYGHAPQIFSFVRGTDTALPEFNNGLDDYGSVYLWTYYCLTKFAEAGEEAQSAFTRALVASQEKSTASFTEVLATVGGPTAEEVFGDWVIANVANDPSIAGGRYGYDETLRFAVQPTTTHVVGESTGKVKADVLPWAADYVTFVTEQTHKPLNPTMVDRVLLLAGDAAELRWTINGGQTPPAAILPEGSRVEDGVAISPVVETAGGRGVVVGPFFRKGVKVANVEFDAGTGNRSVRIFTLDQLVESMEAPAASNFSLRFDGKADEVTGRIVLKGAAGTEVLDLTGGRFERSDLSGVDSITLVVSGNPAKKFKKGKKYSYRASGGRAISSLEKAARLREIESGALEMASASSEAGEFLAGITALRQGHEEAMAETMLADGGVGALDLAGDLATVDAARRDHAVVSARSALRMARFKALDRAAEAGEIEGAVLEAGIEGDDGDDAHDNLGYLLFKAGEPVHGLDHLMIDPALLEGQILKMWRLLEIARGFPHLPIPDGLNVADYDMGRVRSTMQSWSDQFGVGFDAGAEPADLPVADEQDVKHTLRRLKLAGEIVEVVYNNSLLMADDVTISLYDFVRLVFHSIRVSGDIAKVFERIPVVGKAIKYLKGIIHRKLVRLIEITLTMLSAKLKAPYNQYAPMAIALISWVYTKFMALPQDPNDPGNGAGLKELAAKIAGRYALTAVPRIGFVAKGQPQIEMMADYTQSLTHEGSLEEAYRKVMDDGASGTESSVREKLFGQLESRHKTFTRNRKIVRITSRIVTLAQYVGSLDPSNISKIVAIAAGAATTGLLAHSGYRAGSLFVKAQRDYAGPGVRLAFDPGLGNAAFAPEEDSGLPGKLNAAGAEAALARAEAAYAGFEEALRVARQSAGFRHQALAGGATVAADIDEQFRASAEALDLADRELEDSMGEVLALGFAGEAVMEGDSGDLVGAASAEVMARADAVSGVLRRGLGFGSTQLDPAKEEARKAAVQGLVAKLHSAFAALAAEGDEAGARVVVTDSKVKETWGGKLRLEAWVRNTSDVTIEGLSVGLQSGLLFEVEGGATKLVERLKPGRKVKVTWTITPGEEFGFMPMVSIVPVAEGVQGIAKLQRLDAN